MNLYGYEIIREEDLMHYGLKGMHWGTRRWQNEDGTFNSAGKERYFGSGSGDNYKKMGSKSNVSGGKTVVKTTGKEKTGMSDKTKQNLKTAAKVGAVVAGTALVAYGGYKLNQLAKDKLTSEYLALGKEHLIKRDKNNFHADALERWSKEAAAKGENHPWNAAGVKRHRAEANRHDELYRTYTSIAARGQYSAREKMDALKRMARGR